MTQKHLNQFLKDTSICGENFSERMSRFRLIAENDRGTYGLTEIESNALRTAMALIDAQEKELVSLRRKLEIKEDLIQMKWPEDFEPHRKK
jgi:hypothetical protein